MMLPILISVSVAPVSYFFCASALPLEAANTTNAAEAMASLRVVTGITSLPLFENSTFRYFKWVGAFLTESSCDLGPVVTILPKTPQSKAPAAKAQGLLLQ